MAEKETYNMTMADMDKIIDRVVADKIEATITITPEMTEVRLEPWKPYRTTSTYQSEQEG